MTVHIIKTLPKKKDIYPVFWAVPKMRLYKGIFFDGSLKAVKEVEKRTTILEHIKPKKGGKCHQIVIPTCSGRSTKVGGNSYIIGIRQHCAVMQFDEFPGLFTEVTDHDIFMLEQAGLITDNRREYEDCDL